MWILPSVNSGPPWQVLHDALAERKTSCAALRGRGQAAVGLPVGVPRVVQRVQVRHQRLDLVLRGPRPLHALGERLDHRVVEAVLPAVPGPGPGVRDAAERRHLLAAAEVEGAQVLPAVVERVEVQAVGVAVAVAGVAAIPLVERPRGVVEEDLAAAGQRRRLRAAQGDRPDEPGGLGVHDLDGVGEVVRHVERLAVGGKGQLGGPAAQRDPAEPAVALEQLRRQQVAPALVAPGEPLAVGAEDHHLVGAAQARGQQLPVPC